MRSNHGLLAAGIASAIAFATPAAAQTSFTLAGTGSNSATQTAIGAARTFTLISGGKTLQVKVTAWTIKTDGTIAQGAVGVWDSGMGVRWGSESESSPNHTVDDIDGKDFLAFQFDQSVQLTGATFTPFQTSTGYDTDAVVRWGTQSGAWNGDLGLTGDGVSDLAALMPNRIDSADSRSPSNSSAVTRNFTTGSYGNLWMVAAQTYGDNYYDAFKLSQVKIFVPPPPGVPEPATWAMMIIGFGAIGSAMRRKRKIEGADAAATA